MPTRGSLAPFTIEELRKNRKNRYHGLNSYRYTQYLRTEHWINTRRAWYKSGLNDGKCYVCQETKPKYHLHHKTYKELGEEKLWHLIILCPECHQRLHDGLRASTSKHKNLWNAAKIARRRKLRKKLRKEKRKKTRESQI